MSNLTDVGTLPVIDVWGDAVRARRVEGERVTLAMVELAPDALVPGHRHENEQLGMVITGSLTFTVGDETRELGPGGTCMNRRGRRASPWATMQESRNAHQRVGPPSETRSQPILTKGAHAGPARPVPRQHQERSCGNEASNHVG